MNIIVRLQKLIKKGHAVIRTYVLSAPSVSLDEIRSYNSKSSLDIRWLWIVVGVVLFLGGCLIVRRRRRRQVNVISEQSPLSSPETRKTDNSIFGKDAFSKKEFESSIIRPNAVYLFGPFAVIDRNGRDITHLFSS